MRPKLALLLLLLAGSLLAGCASEDNLARLSVQATPTPGEIEAAAANWLNAQVTQQAAQALATPLPQATPKPPDVIDMAATMTWLNMQSQMTQSAVEWQAQLAAGTATSQAYMVGSTQSAAGTQMAWSVTMTQAPIQTMTALPPSQTAESWTQTAVPMYATANAGGVYAQSTIVAGQAMQVDAAARQQRWVVPIQSIVLWCVLAAAVVILGYYVWKASKFHKLTPDGVNWIVEDGARNQQIIATDLLPAPITSISHAGEVTAGGMTDGVDQAEVTERAQKVRAIRAVPEAPSQGAIDLYNSTMGSGEEQPFGLLSPQNVEPPADLQKALDEAWEGGEA